MYKVISMTPARFNSETALTQPSKMSQSGPFPSHEEASRFATGLARAGKTTEVLIEPVVKTADDLIDRLKECFMWAGGLRQDEPVSHGIGQQLTVAMGCITEALEALEEEDK